MYARLPREMLAAVTRDLNVPVGTNTIAEALEYASAQLAGYYSWPWFLSEFTYAFRQSITGTCTLSGGTILELVTYDDPGSSMDFVDQNWRIQIGMSDYRIKYTDQGAIGIDYSKNRGVPIGTATAFKLFHAGLSLPTDYRVGSDFACYHTSLRYRIKHVSRMAFERYWQSYKQMQSNTSLVFADADPYYSDGQGWRHHLQFCPPPAANTEVRVSYQRMPTAIDFENNTPTEWPLGYDEVLELLALGRLAQKTGDAMAMNSAKRAQGLIRQLRGAVATAVMDDTPQTNASFGGASWEQEGLSVLPRETF